MRLDIPKDAGRKTLAILAATACLLFGWIAVSVPMISATAPAILTVACGVVAFFAWPRNAPSQ